MNVSPRRFYEFGPFRIDAVKRLLLRDGETVALKAKCFETLLALVEAKGQVLDKDELMRRVWPDTIVEESNITVYISTLRKALGENPQEHRYIVTVPGRGYSFVAKVKEVWEESAGLTSHEQSRLSLIAEEEEAEKSPEREDGPFLPLWRHTVASPLALRGRRRRPATLASLALFSSAIIIVVVTVAAHLSSPKSDRAIRSLAMLPFATAGNDPDIEYLADGLANDLTNRLSRLPGLTVIPSSAVCRYKAHYPQASAPDAKTIGREFNVEVVVVGKVERREESIYIDVELIDARNNGHLWGELYRRKLTDIFSAQNDIASGISERLRPGLTETEQSSLAKRNTENIEAYWAYLKGRHFWNKRTEEGLQEAIRFFDQALDRDPNYALAYAGLADAYQILAFHGPLSSAEYFSRAKAAARRAIELDDRLAEAHTALAYVKFYYDWDWAGADAEFKRALELNPNYATAHQWYAEYLASMARPDEALSEREKAKALDPLSPIITSELGLSYIETRQYDRAVEEFRTAVNLFPDFSPAHSNLCLALELEGRYDEAMVECQKAMALANNNKLLTELAIIYARSGRRTEAQRTLDEMIRESKERYFQPSYIARVYLALNDQEKAFEWLEKAYRERDWALTGLKRYPVFDGFRSDPRFSDLLKRMGLQ
jgi:DNA-binding winged helix-turn-helix (wHTH) protein/TolB-like protein/Tfp pilus assembly protein PilF